MDVGPACHTLLSVCPLQLHMLCSLCAFVMLERLSAAQVESKVDGLYVFWLLNGGIKVSVEVAALAGVLSGRGGAGGFAIKAALERPA